jgi:hypothetical protein
VGQVQPQGAAAVVERVQLVALGSACSGTEGSTASRTDGSRCVAAAFKSHDRHMQQTRPLPCWSTSAQPAVPTPTLEHARLPEAISVALPNHACQHKGRAPHHADAVGIVVAQVEVAAAGGDECSVTVRLAGYGSDEMCR